MTNRRRGVKTFDIKREVASAKEKLHLEKHGFGEQITNNDESDSDDSFKTLESEDSENAKARDEKTRKFSALLINNIDHNKNIIVKDIMKFSRNDDLKVQSQSESDSDSSESDSDSSGNDRNERNDTSKYMEKDNGKPRKNKYFSRIRIGRRFINRKKKIVVAIKQNNVKKEVKTVYMKFKVRMCFFVLFSNITWPL